MPKRIPNQYRTEGPISYIVCQSKAAGTYEVMVDTDQLEKLQQFTWVVGGPNKNPHTLDKGKTLTLAQVLLPSQFRVKRRNLRGLDFRLANLYTARPVKPGTEALRLSQAPFSETHKFYEFPCDVLEHVAGTTEDSDDVSQARYLAGLEIAHEAIQRALATLTTRQREIIELYYLEQLTQKEAATRLGLAQQNAIHKSIFGNQVKTPTGHKTYGGSIHRLKAALLTDQAFMQAFPQLQETNETAQPK